MDWKRCMPLPMTVNGRFGYAEPPFDRCENINYYKYSLQLHTYRYIFERFYGLNIPEDNLFMVTFHPGAPSFGKLKAAPVADLVEYMFDNHELYVSLGKRAKEIKESVDKWQNEKDEDEHHSQKNSVT